MLGTLYYKGIAGIDSMQEMTEQFNEETVSKNLSAFIGEKAGEYVPHHVTENEYQAGSGVSSDPETML